MAEQASFRRLQAAVRPAAVERAAQREQQVPVRAVRERVAAALQAVARCEQRYVEGLAVEADEQRIGWEARSDRVQPFVLATGRRQQPLLDLDVRAADAREAEQEDERAGAAG